MHVCIRLTHDSDRQRLLAIIEGAFGTHQSFNAAIRRVFSTKFPAGASLAEQQSRATSRSTAQHSEGRESSAGDDGSATASYRSVLSALADEEARGASEAQPSSPPTPAQLQVNPPPRGRPIRARPPHPPLVPPFPSSLGLTLPILPCLQVDPGSPRPLSP